MKFTFSRAIQAIRSPNLVALYLGGKKRFDDNIREFNKQKVRLDSLPSLIRIEPTNKCNLKCVMCPTGQSDNSREVGFMSLELYQKIINELKYFPSPTWIVLYLGGEPLLNPNIDKMIEIAKSNGLYCKFNTNATLLNNVISSKLINNKLDCLCISFDDLTKDEYEKMRVNAKYDRTLMNIINFLELKKNSKSVYPLVSIESLKLKDDKNELQLSGEFKALFKDYTIQNFTSCIAHMWAGDFSDNESYNYKRSSVYYDCYMPWANLTINWKGQVVACCYDLKYDCILGDVNKNSLREIWNSKDMLDFRSMLLNKRFSEIKLCSTCSLLKGEIVSRNF